MFGGLNLKSLQDRLTDSLHDLENTLGAGSPSPSSSPVRPAAGQRAATSPSPSTARTGSATAPPAGRPSLESLAGRAASLVGPLSPTAAAAQQSASQLADSALSSLRASLRKGRASLEGVAAAAPPATRPSGETAAAAARSSTDGRARSSPRRRGTGSLRREGSNDSFREEEEMRKLRELASPPPASVQEEVQPQQLVSLAEDDKPTLQTTKGDQDTDFFAPSPPPEPAADSDQLVDLSEPAPAPRALSPVAPPFKPAKSTLAPPTPQPDSAGEDDDAWGMGEVDDAPRTPVVPPPAAEVVVLNEPLVAGTPGEEPAAASEVTVEAGEGTGTIAAVAGGEDVLPLAETALEAHSIDESAVQEPRAASTAPTAGGFAAVSEEDKIEEEEVHAVAAAGDQPSTDANLDRQQTPTAATEPQRPHAPAAPAPPPASAPVDTASLDEASLPAPIPSAPEDSTLAPAVKQVAATAFEPADPPASTLSALPTKEAPATPAAFTADLVVEADTLTAVPLSEALSAADAPGAVEGVDAVTESAADVAGKTSAAAAGNGEAPSLAADSEHGPGAAEPPVSSDQLAGQLAEKVEEPAPLPAGVSRDVADTPPTGEPQAEVDAVPAAGAEEPAPAPASPTVVEKETVGASPAPMWEVSVSPAMLDAAGVGSAPADSSKMAVPAGSPEAVPPATAFEQDERESPQPKSVPAADEPSTALPPKEAAEPAHVEEPRVDPVSEAVEATQARSAATAPAPTLSTPAGISLPAETKATLDRLVSIYLAPLDSIADLDAVESALQNLKGKEEMATLEIKRLTSQLERRKEAVEELRDTHRLEHKSQQDEIDSLRTQLAEKDARLVAAEAAAAQTRTEVSKSADEYDKLKVVAKEEEEKRIKALSLLRALRQKLVKVEQEKGDYERVLGEARAGEKQAQDTLKADRARFDLEIVALRAAQEQQVNKLKQGFERETANLKAQYDRDAMNRKGQFELDAITAKSQQAKELAARDTRIQQLEATVRELSTARDSVFDQLQLRQAEIESSAAQQEALRTRAAELEYEAAEQRDRAAALQDEVDELRRHRHDTAREEGSTRRVLEEAEARHAAKVRDLEARAWQLEKDRREVEDEMGRNLQDRLREVERLRAALAKKDVDFADSVQNSQKREKEIDEAQKARAEVEKRLKAVEATLEALRDEAERAQQAEAAAKEELSDRLQRAAELEARLEEVQTRESNLRSTNRTLREELRKLQSGVLLSEKQRQPGVGYFAAFSQQSAPRTSIAASASTTSLVSPPLTSPPSSAAAGAGLSAVANPNGNADEAISYEYLRNVVLQFLERPEMRPQLVQVLGVILQFTPAELRRLAAKSAAQ